MYIWMTDLPNLILAKVSRYTVHELFRNAYSEMLDGSLGQTKFSCN